MVTRETLAQTGLATAATRGRTAVRAWHGMVVGGPEAGHQFTIGGRPMVVGADAACDLVLTDERVSRRHLEIAARPEGIHVRDLGSTNGTTWQGSRVEEATLSPGSTVTLGGTTLRFLAAPAPLIDPSPRCVFGALVGRSVAMRELFAVLELASETDATIIVQGESGTGKELAARAVHDASSRAEGPFVVVDGSAITESLAESHLFGHVEGAFTGAVQDRRGAFVEADGGTLFIDELGELPLTVQAKLLRVLESGTVHPVGADRAVQVDVRVVAATHRDIVSMVEREEFRFDLFHRLAVVHVALPPLRDRREDLPLLVRHFYAAKGVPIEEPDGPNMDLLRNYTWPGNVRELRNVLERAWALGGGPEAPFEDLGLWLGAPAARSAADLTVDDHLPFKVAKEQWVNELERRYLAAVYARFDHNILQAAAHAGINRRHFRELLKKHGLHQPR